MSFPWGLCFVDTNSLFVYTYFFSDFILLWHTSLSKTVILNFCQVIHASLFLSVWIPGLFFPPLIEPCCLIFLCLLFYFCCDFFFFVRESSHFSQCLQIDYTKDYPQATCWKSQGFSDGASLGLSVYRFPNRGTHYACFSLSIFSLEVSNRLAPSGVWQWYSGSLVCPQSPELSCSLGSVGIQRILGPCDHWVRRHTPGHVHPGKAGTWAVCHTCFFLPGSYTLGSSSQAHWAVPALWEGSSQFTWNSFSDACQCGSSWLWTCLGYCDLTDFWSYREGFLRLRLVCKSVCLWGNYLKPPCCHLGVSFPSPF